jgi:hypothetical protein
MSGGFEAGDLLSIYCEKGNPEYWEDWMNLFLKEGNLIWVIEEVMGGNNIGIRDYLAKRFEDKINLS